MADKGGGNIHMISNMSEEDKDKYIKCSCWKSNYINDDENTIKNFGYNKLNERFKTCVKCRDKKKKTTKMKKLRKR